jgi:SAM-dependent methyltransferase
MVYPLDDRIPPVPGRLGSWHSGDYVAEWAGDDVLAELLDLPRRISAALVADSGIDVRRVVDIGSGAGPYLDVLLRAFPSARGTWVDSSEPMQRLAREQLATFGDRVEYVIGDAERIEEVELPRAAVVVTSRMAHHLSPEALQRFYRGVFQLLEPGGFFFNLDHYGAPAGWEARYRRIRRQFTGPRKKALRPHRHDFPLSEPGQHLAWLESAGFEPGDIPWRTFYSALLAARRPT